MRLTLRLSPSLQQSINGELQLNLEGQTIGHCLEYGKQLLPELRELLFRENRLNPQILLFHNNTLIKESDFSTQLTGNDVLDIIPAIEAG